MIHQVFTYLASDPRSASGIVLQIKGLTQDGMSDVKTGDGVSGMVR
jgi:hypothetical protein